MGSVDQPVDSQRSGTCFGALGADWNVSALDVKVTSKCGDSRQVATYRILIQLSIAWLVAGCHAMGAAPVGAGAPAARVTGTVTYLQRVALPPEALIKLHLLDVSRADAPAVMLGEQVITASGRQLPFAFEITYDPARIDPRMTYAISARVEEGGRLRFISDQRHAVITRGAPSHVDIVLKAVGGAQK